MWSSMWTNSNHLGFTVSVNQHCKAATAKLSSNPCSIGLRRLADRCSNFLVDSIWRCYLHRDLALKVLKGPGLFQQITGFVFYCSHSCRRVMCKEIIANNEHPHPA